MKTVDLMLNSEQTYSKHCYNRTLHYTTHIQIYRKVEVNYGKEDEN